MSLSWRPADIRAATGHGGNSGRDKAARSAAASWLTVLFTYSGRIVDQTQGNPPGMVARWRQIRLTTRTLYTWRISAKISAIKPVASLSEIAGIGSPINPKPPEAQTVDRTTTKASPTSWDIRSCRGTCALQISPIRLSYQSMDIVAAMQVFVRVAEAGGFTSVARETRSTQPTVSRLVAALEDPLGARLFHRSTRAVSLTDDAKQFYQLARHALEAIAEAEKAIAQRRTLAFGRLRLSIPVAFGRLHIAPRMPRFLELNPEVQVELVMSDNFVDLVQEGIDLPVRVGEIADPTRIPRRITTPPRLTPPSPPH